MLRRLHLLRPSGLACRYLSSPLNLPQRPPYFRDENSGLYISEAFWNKLGSQDRKNLLEVDTAYWNFVRQKEFALNPQSTTDGKLNFGKLWLKPLDEVEIKNRTQRAPTLHGHPNSDRFLGGTVFWDEDASGPAKGRITFVNNNTFEVQLKPVGPGGTPPDTTLWGHLKNDNDGRLAIVRGVSGSGKTVALLRHPAHAKVVTFYFKANDLLQLEDTRKKPPYPTFSNFFTDRATNTADKKRRNEAAELAVAEGVQTLLSGIAFSKDPSVNVLVAIDEAGDHPEFVRALCSCSADILENLRAFFGTRNVFIAVAGTGVETSALAPGSENKRYKMLEPITPVWSRLCDCIAELKCVLPHDEKKDTRLHKLTREFVSNARAAWALATVFTSRSDLKMSADNTLATSALPDLCAEAARLLRQKNGLADVSEQSLPYLFVQAAFLQCQITPLVKDDFLLANHFGVLRDTATLISNNARPPANALKYGRELTADEACLESTKDKAYVEDELRRFEMPATFTAWLHFSLGFGLQSPAGDGLEELTAQYAALALMSRKASYFTPAYWSVVEKRMKRLMPSPWKVPFRLFDELSQLPGRHTLAAVEIFHLGKRFGPATVMPKRKHENANNSDWLEAVRTAVGDKVTPTTPVQPSASHKVVINGPMAEFADLLVFTQGSPTLCLIQCKGSDKLNDGAGSRFNLRDLFTELYKMGCEDDMSRLAGCLNAAQKQREHDPFWMTAGVDELAVAACIAARKYDEAFALGTQIVAEEALFAKCSSEQLAKLQPLIAARDAADKTLLNMLRATPVDKWKLKEIRVPLPDLASDQAHLVDAFRVLESFLQLKAKTMAPKKEFAAAAALAQIFNSFAETLSQSEERYRLDNLLEFSLPHSPMCPPFWRRKNPSAALLEALRQMVNCDTVERCVLVWGRPVEAVPAWCVPQGCTLVQAEPWNGKTWPPTNLYPLQETSVRDRCATKMGPADNTLLRSEGLRLP